MGKKFISDIKKLMDKNRAEDQAYIRGVVLLFLEVYARTLEERQEKGERELKSIVNKVRGELPKLVNKDMDSLRAIEEHMVGYMEHATEQVDGTSPGTLYQEITSSVYKKKTGQIYTPHYIIDHMVGESITESRLIEKPYLKVLDPACGSGYFLVAIYRKLLSIFVANRDRIVTKSPELLGEYERGISNFIVDKCIYGVEKDTFSAGLSRIALAIESGIESNNIECRDMLLDPYDGLVDIVIGNPPYIGTKSLDGEYKRRLREAYSKVYEDKSDISYCFFQRAKEILSDGGELNIISSRYMMEAHYAKGLREYIDREYDIECIWDFYGENVFKGVSVSPAIFKFRRPAGSSRFSYGRVKRRQGKGQLEDLDQIELFEVDRSRLKSDSWVMEPDSIYGLYDRVDKSGDVSLRHVAVSNQGIITGCDKAFVIDGEHQIPECERECLKPWIKNSGVKSYRIESPNKFIISLGKGDLERYPLVGSHLERYRSQLEGRRECKLGSKHWYELQWGRDKSKFIGKRIVFPYKADKNRFALVEDEIYHSADVYSLRVREDYRGIVSEEYLLAYLNSSLFEFYFKVGAKKVGAALYEYYPNRLINLNLKLGDRPRVEQLVSEMIHSQGDRNRDEISEKIDEYFFNLYDISEKERALVRDYIKDA